jgi:nucleoid-associated protein YgaU
VAVITTMTQKFTMFKQDGTPVRATVEVTFRQDRDPNAEVPQNPTSGGGDVERIWRVVAGQRLDTIAYEVYGDATKWRLIADRNRLVDPLRLRGGQHLSIPPA